MLTTLSQRLIQFKRIAVLTDLASDSENVVRYAGSLARWYGSELFFVHALGAELHAASPSATPPRQPASGVSAKQGAEATIRALIDKLSLKDLAPRLIVQEASIGKILQEVDEHHPSLVVVATHGREGVRKWVAGSVAEEVFRRVQWPVLVLGPGFSVEVALQKQFEHILYATDLSAVSLAALQYAAGISHDHEAHLTVLYVEPDPRLGFSFDRALAEQRLHDWLQDHIDGLAETLVGVRCVADFGKPEEKIVEAASEPQADLVILGARGLGTGAGAASHFLGGTAYGVACTSKSPTLIVPQPR